MTRMLGPTERMFYKMKEYGGMNGYAFAHGKALGKPLSDDALRTTLAHVMRGQALLRSTASVQEGARPTYDPVTDAEVDLVFISTADETPFNDALHQVIHKPYTDGALLWRVSVIQYPENSNGEYPFSMIVGFEHSIADGTLMCHFIADVMQAYDAVISGKEQPDNSGAFKDKPAPSLEDYTKYRLSWRDFKHFIPAEFLKMIKPPVHPEFSEKADFDARTTGVLFQSFDAKTLSALVDRSRQKGVTLHGMLGSALLQAMAALLKQAEPAESYRLALASNVSMRGEHSIPPNQVGCYISAVSSMFAISEQTDAWRLAKQVVTDIAIKKGKNLHLSSNIIYEFLQRLLPESFRIGLLNGDPQGRLETMVLSNVGRLSLNLETTGTRLEEMGFGAGQHGFGPSVMVGIASTANGLGMTLHYVEPLFTKADAENLLGLIRTQVLALLESEALEPEVVNVANGVANGVENSVHSQ